MILCRTIDELKAQQKKMWSGGSKPSIGFVPTMGYLHEGHASLMRQAAAENDITVLSIFVNPLQFGPSEDFETYPRNEQRDLSIAAENGVDLVFMPSVSEMYPRKVLTKVLVSDVTDRLCGASRPGHFDGVGTVVSKLFHLVQPHRAYFGMKDAQQVAVIAQMTDDLNFPVTIVPCPIIREPDGLALSSRNVYLNAEQRAQAVALSSSLAKAREWMKETSLTPAALENKVRAAISEAPLANIDYVEVLEYPALATPAAEMPFQRGQQRYILALAVKFGSTRLIDNELFEPLEVNGNV